MSPLESLEIANGRTLKRSFTAVTISGPSLHPRAIGSTAIWVSGSKSKLRIGQSSTQASGLERPNQLQSEMPSAAGPRMYENHIPSFMSVYDMDASLLETPNLAPSTIKLSRTTCATQHPHHQPQPRLLENETEKTHTQIHSHQHRESTSTQTSDSTDSSPTTTISTIDSSSLSDPSPSSSPESPITLVPLSSFSRSTLGLDSFQELKMNDGNQLRLPLNDERPMTSPLPRKPKNPKSLALNLSPRIDAFQTSEPSSPSFIKPPPLKARKKPSLLSLNTGAANKLSLSVEPLASPSVPTMLQRRSLKHSISSPQMLSTPSFGPSGGMTFGERKGLTPSRFKESNLATNTFTIDEDSQEVPTGVQMATRVPGMTVGGDTFDRAHMGEDAKSPSYPDGPILMHEPSVHLYLEPKVGEAMKFDVVINVAREVKNPFQLVDEQREAKSGSPETVLDSIDIASESDAIPDTAATTATFKTAFEIQPSSSSDSSPTTPKPTDTKRPEYIHVPWDHNTDVKDELWDLCETIESRTKEGKKVLVHCQQGASRSATLIIAYGMYLNPDLGPSEAYAMAQAKSRWVNPNMSLLFSLNDFKKVIEKKRAERSKAVRKPHMKHKPSLSADTLDLPSTPSRARGNSTPSTAARDAILARPEDIRDPPPTDSAIERLSRFDFGFGDLDVNNQPRGHRGAEKMSTESETNVSHAAALHASDPQASSQHRLSHQIVEARKSYSEWEDLMSPRLTEMTNNPLQSFSRSFGAPDIEEPPTPNLFSPRTFEFPRSSFFPSPVAPAIILPAEEDPRSPPTKGEAPITRSIDDFL